ncbi:Spo0E family sporulation regulatory protein-aspartic acid phosphatase [Paenibacillus taichungensis]
MMTKKRVHIQRRIDRARKHLHLLVEKHGGIQHPAVIKQSMVLDDLINLYNRDIAQEKKQVE